MIRSMQIAIIKKDFKGITSNKRLFSALLIVPLMMAVVLPSIFILMTAFLPAESNDFKELINMIPGGIGDRDLKQMVLDLLINSIMPIFFMIIPIMAASVMAASSFVGEKEKRTLETLLYSPLSLGQIVQAKIMASLAMSMMISFLSFAAMVAAVEIEGVVFLKQLLPFGINWLITMLLLSPAISVIAITMIVRGSAKAATMEEAQQQAAFLIVPLALVLVGQFTGVVMVSDLLLFVLAVVLVILAVFFIRMAFRRLTYEILLKR